MIDLLCLTYKAPGWLFILLHEVSTAPLQGRLYEGCAECALHNYRGCHCLLRQHWQVDSLTMNHQGSPITKCVHAQSCLTLCESMDVACQAPLSMEFSRQEYWSGLPFSPPGNLPNPGIEPTSPVLAGGFFTHCTIWEAQINPSYNFVQI